MAEELLTEIVDEQKENPTTQQEESTQKKEVKKKTKQNKGKTKREETETENKKKPMNAWLSLLIKIAVIAALLFACSFFVQVTFLHNNEMFPSLRDGDLIITAGLSQYSFNDVVLYEVERNGKKEKHFGRVMCLGNNDVELESTGGIRVNGSVLGINSYYEEYDHGTIEYPYHVPDDCIFVMQDYRPETTDSRTFGGIPVSSIIGKVLFSFRIRGF